MQSRLDLLITLGIIAYIVKRRGVRASILELLFLDCKLLLPDTFFFSLLRKFSLGRRLGGLLSLAVCACLHLIVLGLIED